MKKLIIISSCIVVLCLIVSFGVLPSIKNISNENNVQENDTSSSVNLTYVVKSFNGNIAVFDGIHETPFRITDVPVNSLPYTDQEILKKGIAVSSKTELTKILEDYCS